MNRAPATKQSWVLLTFLFTVSNLLETILFSNLTSFTPVFLRGLGFDEPGVKLWTGILASAGIALGFWFVPFWGVLADRHGRKLLIIRSFAIESISVLLMAFSQSIWVFLFGRMMSGLALGNTGLMFATLAEEAPRERVGFAIGLVAGSGPLGMVLGSFLGGLVVSQYGVHWLFALDAIMISLVVVMLGVLYHESFTPGRAYPITAMLRSALRAVLHTPMVRTLFTFSFIATFGYFFAAPFVPNRILELVGDANSGGSIGLAMGVAGIATLIGTPLWGLAADRFGHRRLLPLVTALTGLLYLPLYLANDIVQFTLRLFLLYGVSPAVNSLTYAIVGLETPSDKRGAVMSMIYMPLNAAILFAPPLAVVVTNQLRDVFLYSGMFMLAGAIFILAMRKSGEATAVAR